MDGQGQLLGVYDPRQLTTGDWFAQSIMPLHKGDWLGVELRIFYAVMGLGTSLMIGMGFWLWVNRRLSGR